MRAAEEKLAEQQAKRQKHLEEQELRKLNLQKKLEELQRASHENEMARLRAMQDESGALRPAGSPKASPARHLESSPQLQKKLAEAEEEERRLLQQVAAEEQRQKKAEIEQQAAKRQRLEECQRRSQALREKLAALNWLWGWFFDRPCPTSRPCACASGSKCS